MQEHAIHKQVFSFHFTNETTAFYAQHQLEHVVAGACNRLIGAILDQQDAGSDSFHVIEKLDIDLGIISLDTIRDGSVVDKICTGVREALQRTAYQQVPYTQMEQQLQQYFLHAGSFPWWAGATMRKQLLEKLQSGTTARQAITGKEKAMHAIGLWRSLQHAKRLPGRKLRQQALAAAMYQHRHSLNLHQLDETDALQLLALLQQHRDIWLPFEALLQQLLQSSGLPVISLRLLQQVTALAEAAAHQPHSSRLHTRQHYTTMLPANASPLPAQALTQLAALAKEQARLHSVRYEQLLELPGFLSLFFLLFPRHWQHNEAAITLPHTASLAEHIQVLKQDLEAVLQGLKWAEIALLKQLVQTGKLHTTAEKTMVAEVLAQLPVNAVTWMEYLARLNAEKYELLVTVTEAATPAEAMPDDGGYISNAGLCLVAPYLPAFFRQLRLLENGQFKTVVHAQKAACLLHYLATGETHAPEYELPFNKILCGLPLHESFAVPLHISSKQQAEADSLLESVITHWAALKNTSPQGFRQAFLQREGKLDMQENKYLLRVARKSHDLLLGSLPWSFHLIKCPWMASPVLVEWEYK